MTEHADASKCYFLCILWLVTWHWAWSILSWHTTIHLHHYSSSHALCIWKQPYQRCVQIGGTILFYAFFQLFLILCYSCSDQQRHSKTKHSQYFPAFQDWPLHSAVLISFSFNCPFHEQNNNILVEFLHRLNPSSLPLAHLTLKLAAPSFCSKTSTRREDCATAHVVQFFKCQTDYWRSSSSVETMLVKLHSFPTFHWLLLSSASISPSDWPIINSSFNSNLQWLLTKPRNKP